MRVLISTLLLLASLCAVPLLSPYLPFLDVAPFQKGHEYAADDLEGLAHLAAMLHDLNPEIFIAQMRQESRFNQHALSTAGALGVAQIMPGTAKSWKVDPHEPLQALDAAATHMAAYVRTYKAQGHDEQTAYRMALAAYNAGPGAVAKYKGIPPFAETRTYVKTIMGKK